MALNNIDIMNMMSGFAAAGYICRQHPSSPQNPVKFEWTDAKGFIRKYRLWVYDVTHGGGGRSASEYRIQITNAPSQTDGLDHDGATDLLLGYSRTLHVIVAYDRRWLEKRMQAGTGSPSVQVGEEDVQAALQEGMRHITKAAAFGSAGIVTLTPEFFPNYLLNHDPILRGQMNINQAPSAVIESSSSVWQYCLERGFFFTPDMLARYVASIATKPFVILAGVSGTGKSKMAELVAEFYSATMDDSLTNPSPSTVALPGDKFVFSPNKNKIDRSRFALVPVRPDWIDNQSILGFVNPITTRYESTQALDLMLRANYALTTANDGESAPRYFMLLDEMNLARVEHYFSDWLACAESRRYQHDGSISQQPIPLHRHGNVKTNIIDADGNAGEMDVPSNLPIPINLIVTGTVNVDETTFGFSPKVLDRSMVIEFNDVDLEGLRNGNGTVDASTYRFPEVLPPFHLATVENFKSLPDGVHSHLVAINNILEEAQLHFGYRSAAEIALFMQVYNNILPEVASDTNMIRALDGAVLQKVLPRIQGNRARIEHTLETLLFYFRDLALLDGREDNSLEGDENAQLPMSYRRGLEMLKRLRDFGFVTFFK